MNLSPFQQTCVDRDDNRIVLQDRRTGLTTMFAHLAIDRALQGEDVIYTTHQRPRVFVEDYLIPAIADRNLDVTRHGPTLCHLKNEEERIGMIRAATADDSVRGSSASVYLVDQANHVSADWFNMFCVPVSMTSQSEWVVGATGDHFETDTALNAAVKTGGFSLIWSDFREALPRDMHDVPQLDTHHYEHRSVDEKL